MWTETKFNVTRREASSKRPFGEVVAAIEASAPVVRDRLDALVTNDIKAEAVVSEAASSEWRNSEERSVLPIPPAITAEMAKGFTLYMVKAVNSGRADEVVDLAKTNLWR